MYEQPKINLNYVLVALATVLFTWLLHEFSHWLTGELLGNDMAMRLNAAYPVSGKYVDPSHANIISLAAPLVTLGQGLVVYYLLKNGRTWLLFPMLLTCLYMRAMAAGISVINPNDEARVSQSWGIGTFTLPLLLTGILFYLVYDVVKSRKISTKVVLLTLLLIMLFSSIIILSDQAGKPRIL